MKRPYSIISSFILIGGLLILSACGNSSKSLNSSQKEAENIIRNYFDAVDAGDKDKLTACYHPLYADQGISANRVFEYLGRESFSVEYSITNVLEGYAVIEEIYAEAIDFLDITTEEFIRGISDEDLLRLYQYGKCSEELELYDFFCEHIKAGDEILMVYTDSDITSQDKTWGFSDRFFIILWDENSRGICFVGEDGWSSSSQAAEPAESAINEYEGKR